MVFTWVADGWMTCDSTSFLTVFQSYQNDGDNERLCAVEPFAVDKISTSGPGSNPEPLDQWSSV